MRVIRDDAYDTFIGAPDQDWLGGAWLADKERIAGLRSALSFE